MVSTEKVCKSAQSMFFREIIPTHAENKNLSKVKYCSKGYLF